MRKTAWHNTTQQPARSQGAKFMVNSSIPSIEFDLNRYMQDTIKNFDINVINFDLKDEAQIESNYKGKNYKNY